MVNIRELFVFGYRYLQTNPRAFQNNEMRNPVVGCVVLGKMSKSIINPYKPLSTKVIRARVMHAHLPRRAVMANNKTGWN